MCHNPETLSCIEDWAQAEIKQENIQMWRWENWTATCKRMKLEHSLSTIHKVKLETD